MKILILDTTHGGEILTERYIAAGHEVTCADVYHVTPPEGLDKIRSMGATVTETAPMGNYDLVVMPCHCPDGFLANCTYKERIFFSDAVNRLILDKRFRIEITGVKGKTSTCYLLAHLLDACGKKVFLHTSRGQGPYNNGKHDITAYKSIAPTSLLTLPEGDYDVMVCEVSLGGSAEADIGCITNLLENYGIAKDTRKAEEGKKAVLCNKINVVMNDEIKIWEAYGKPLVGIESTTSIIGKPEFGKPLGIRIDYNGKQEVNLGGDYLALQYIQAIDAALTICKQMDIPTDCIIKGLESFKGVPGRGEINEVDGVKYLKERNPGISHMSIRRTLECLKEMDCLKDSFMILDPVSKKVCDKMKTELIREVVKEFDTELYVTAGDGVRPAIPEGTRTVIEFIKEGYQ